MIRKNRYVTRSRISCKQLRQIVRYLTLDLSASQMALLAGLNRNTVYRYGRAIRERIAQYCETQFPFSSKVEINESRDALKARARGERQNHRLGTFSTKWASLH